MTAAGPGPKMILDQVEAAERVVADSVQQMQAVAQQLQAQSALSLTAMLAATLPGARVVTLQGQGHVAQLTAPELFAAALLCFLRDD